MKSFASLGISESLVKALSDLKITTPTEIQEKAIPVLSNGTTNFIGLANTGTGKTAAFGLPLLQNINGKDNALQALVLVPTRELCQQVTDQLVNFAKYLPDLTIECIAGGAPVKPQIKALKQAVHVVVATPGRLIDLLNQDAVDLSTVKYLVLDEADEMLNLGFKEGLEQIIRKTAREHATWLFSATMSGAIKQLVSQYVKAPVAEVRINTGAEDKADIIHQFVLIDPIEKFEILTHFLNEHEEGRGIIFCRTKAAVQKLHKQLAINRFSSGAIHGDLPQGLRDRVMDQFRAEQIKILVASDVAARGIDVEGLAYVIHYHLPEVAEVYTHRSGRTGRAGKSGVSLSFVYPEEKTHLQELEMELGIVFSPMARPQDDSIESNQVYLWARRIAKMRMESDLDKGLRKKVGEVFKSLTKEELIDRLVAEQLASKKPLGDPRGLDMERVPKKIPKDAHLKKNKNYRKK